MNRPSTSLGRGLGALLGGKTPSTGQAGVSKLPVDSIQAGPSQPRAQIRPEQLAELAASIKAKGVIQPIVVRALTVGSVVESASGPPRYEIVAGERRWRAAKLAGLSDIPVVVQSLSDQEAVAIALIENIQREDLTPAEEAMALQRLIGEFELTHLEVANAVGRSRAAVTNLLRLLDLPHEVVALVESRALGMGHARALLGLTTDEARSSIAALVAEKGLSVRETESLVRKALKPETANVSKAPELTVVSEVLRTEALHVQLQQKASGTGKLIVEFRDQETRDRVVEAIKGMAGSR